MSENRPKPEKIAKVTINNLTEMILYKKQDKYMVSIISEFLNKDNEWDNLVTNVPLEQLKGAVELLEKAKFEHVAKWKETFEELEKKEPKNLDLFITKMEEQIKWDIKTYALYGDLEPDEDGLVRMRYSDQAFKETIRQVAEKCNIDPIELGQYLDEIGYDEIQLFDEGFKDVHISFDPTCLDFIVEVEELEIEEKKEGENNE